MKAKTYKSTNFWTAPQSLNTFGIPVISKKRTLHLGLEEFNFCSILTEFKHEGKKVAYIPAFSTCIRVPIDKLELFYHDGNGITLFYATMYDVEQIDIKEIPLLRMNLIAKGFSDFVADSLDFQINYAGLFPSALKIWNVNFMQNNIIAPGHDPRFVLNVKYKSIEFHSPLRIVNWTNFKRARALYH